jgi:hypothetical protein
MTCNNSLPIFIICRVQEVPCPGRRAGIVSETFLQLAAAVQHHRLQNFLACVCVAVTCCNSRASLKVGDKGGRATSPRK